MPGPKIKNGKRKRPSGKSSRPPDGQIRPSSRRQKGPGTRKKVAPEPSGQLLACFQVLDGIADPALIYDLWGTVVRTNAAARKSFGFNPAGMTQSALVKKLSTHTSTAGKKLKREAFISARALAGKAVRDREYRFTDAMGKERTVLSSAAPVKDRGETAGALVVWHDVTERRRAQREVEDLSRFPSENPNPVLRSDRSGTVLYSNPAAAKAFGRSQCGPGLLLPAGLCRMAIKARKTGRLVRGEVLGDHRVFHVTAVPVKGNEYINIYALDITERKQAEEALRESEQRLKKAQGMAHLGSWELDLAAGALTWSDEVYRIFGLQPGEFGATYEAFLEMVHPEDRETVDAAYADSIRGGKNGYEIEHRVIRKGTGEVRIVHEKCEHLRDGSGKIVRSVGMVHDITEMKKTEQALEELNSSLEKTIIQRTRELISAHMELERAKRLSSIGTLAATVAHELRTPLGTIGLAAANLGRKAGNPALAGYIEKIQRKVVESNRIISNLLTYTGLRLPRPEIVRLDRIVTEALKTVREKFPRMRIRVTKDLAAVAKTTLAADEVQLLEIFNNLLANAYQAIGGRAGLIEVTGRIENDAAAVVTIRDNGKGIDEEEMERVFEPFYSGKKTGTGLGLPLSKELAELHGGSIKIVSAKEKGTAVTVTIPLHRGV